MNKQQQKSVGSSIQDRSTTLDTALNLFRASYGALDALRRAQGNMAALFGLDPSEAGYRIIGSGPYWRLRDYGDNTASHSLLVIAAPIKRPYVWDLTPAASAIRYCIRQGLHVYLLEWLPASQSIENAGLDEYVSAISDCITKISTEGERTKPFLIGHSLGGTLAAINGAWASANIRGLVLLGAPLSFAPDQSRFRDALVTLVPSGLSDDKPFPGSLLSQMSALASPDTFIWSRLTDAAFSIGDRDAMETHARIERWALDEVALPGKLVHQIIEWLYRENRFYLGTLKIGGTPVGPSTLRAPVLAVANTADEVAPLASIKPFIDAMPTAARLLEYSGEVGVCLQHLGILVGRQARRRVWPQIVSWLNSQGQVRSSL